MRLGTSIEDVHAISKIDPWFLKEIKAIVDMEAKIRENGLPETSGWFRRLKAMGFADARLAELAGLTETEVAARRRALKVHPVYKRIDTCAAEFAAPPPTCTRPTRRRSRARPWTRHAPRTSGKS